MLQLFKDCEQLVKFGSGTAQREAYVMFTDLLVVFARQLRKYPRLASLVHVPEPSLQQTLQVCICVCHVALHACTCDMYM